MTELDQLLHHEHANPHALLGPHPDNGRVRIRVLQPNASAIQLVPARVDFVQMHPGGIFEATVADLPERYELEIEYPDGATHTTRDPYSFRPTLGEIDLHLFGEGRHEHAYEKLGAHFIVHEEVRGTAFAVWAPAARSVS